MFHVDERCCGSKRAVVSHEKQVLRRMTRIELRGADRLYPRVTIDALPDNVLLETFEFYLSKDDADTFDYHHNYDGWQTLVHVCCRWRWIVFTSPRRLDLKLYCIPRRSVNSKTLDIWPELPIVLYAHMKSKEDVTNVIAALRYHNRVCKINYRNGQFQDPVLEEFAAIDEPFPALTSLDLVSYAQNVPVLPDSFLGGSAPRLRRLMLQASLIHQLETYFYLPLTLSTFPFGVFLIPDILHPR